MKDHELELSIGEILQVGEYTVTVVDIDGAEVGFRIDSLEEQGEVAFAGDADAVFPAR
ncbi:MAG: hypothetical protein WD066_12340 [Planctomycetaceae bacterium]